MKKIILIVIIILFNLFNTKANSDSLTYKIDSICITDDREINDSTFEKYEECLVFESNIKEEKQTKNLKEDKADKLESKSKPENWFSDAWDAITDLWKPVWGLYTEDGYRQEGPYFTFDRNISGPTYTQIQMGRLKDKIILFPFSSERIIYKDIFEIAGTTTIDNCNGVIIPNPIDGSAMCGAAARAKASAFVYLVGLNSTGGALTNTEREGYRDRALAYLRDVKIQGLNNTFDLISAIPGVGVINSIIPLSPASIAAGLQWEQLIWRAKELQMICQAWDMLRWCYNIDPALPNDGLVR